ncbi:MAG: DUF1062 domain-containing protein [Lachnospiraceae bacterium]|nr:DUF1062 domain-containing protein [Lachnospiraceae bacterium]
MSYLKKIEYEIVLKDSFLVIHGCPKCDRKTHFKNTKKFRVNANGNKLDIWLIYQCEKCKHTLNLTIYERQKVSSIPKEEYQGFLDNNEQLAEMYGRNMQLFRKNKADINFDSLDYDFVKLHETLETNESGEQLLITINNPYQLKIRPEKQIAEVLGLSRSQVKNLLEKKEIELKMELPQFISIRINSSRFYMDE